MNFDNFVLLFCNGNPPSRERLRKVAPHPALIACADGGAQKAITTGYKPNLIVGDLDSLVRSDAELKNTEIVKISSQDNNDFEKTLDFMLQKGWNNFLIAAFAGGRIDQTMANMQIAYEYSKKCTIALVDDEYVIVPVTQKLVEKVPCGTLISIIPMEDDTIVSTEGLVYELSHDKIRKGGQGISNRAVKDKIVISIHKGGVLVFIKDV